LESLPDTVPCLSDFPARFDGPLSWVIGKSGKPPACSNHAPSGNRCVPISLFVRRFLDVPLRFDYRTGSSTAKEHPVKAGRCGFKSRTEKSKPSLVHPALSFRGQNHFDGSM